MLEVHKSNILLASEVKEHVDLYQKTFLEYVVTGVNFHDLNGTTEQINERFVDNMVSDGYLLGDVSFALVTHNGQPAVKVVARDLHDWLEEAFI